MREIAQEQQKVQEKVRENYTTLSSRSNFAKLMIGADEDTIKKLQDQIAENGKLVQRMEQLKTQTRVRADLEKIQETIDLIKYQDESLQNKIQLESQYKGLFGWLLKLFK